MHAVAAGAFFFGFNYLTMHASLETSLMWAAVTAVAAALLAWTQSKRMGGK